MQTTLRSSFTLVVIVQLYFTIPCLIAVEVDGHVSDEHEHPFDTADIGVQCISETNVLKDAMDSFAVDADVAGRRDLEEIDSNDIGGNSESSFLFLDGANPGAGGTVSCTNQTISVNDLGMIVECKSSKNINDETSLANIKSTCHGMNGQYAVINITLTCVASNFSEIGSTAIENTPTATMRYQFNDAGICIGQTCTIPDLKAYSEAQVEQQAQLFQAELQNQATTTGSNANFSCTSEIQSLENIDVTEEHSQSFSNSGDESSTGVISTQGFWLTMCVLHVIGFTTAAKLF